MSKDTGGPAFPSMRDMRHNPDFDHEEGISLRDYFAARMMTTALAREMKPWADYNLKNAAHFAYEIADAMLEAREA